MKFYIVLAILPCLIGLLSAQKCGRQAGGVLCPNNICCSESGWCGTTPTHCGVGYQSHCKFNTIDECNPPQVVSLPPYLPIELARCGRDANGALCPNGLCCSNDGHVEVHHYIVGGHAKANAIHLGH